MSATTNDELFARAQRSIPGGVNSPVRAFKSVGGAPYFVTRAAGAHIWDVEDVRRIDYVQSYGAIILGHADKRIVDAVQRAAVDGTSYGAPTEREVELAEAIIERVPSVELVRLVSSGTEATMTAIRIARGVTGRPKLVKFAGCYHGHSDALLVEGGSGLAMLGVPGTAGVTDNAVADTIVAPYNQVPTLDADTACVIIEPVAANMGLVPPAPGFLEGLRAECDRVGALLIFDEVISGFRLAVDGAQGMLARAAGSGGAGVTPDLTTYGKVIGGGLPIGAIGGRADVMSVLAPDGPVYQAGTLSGNPLATAAGLAALDVLTPDVYEQIEVGATRLADGLQQVFDEAAITATVGRVGTLVGLYFGDHVPVDYDDARTTAEPTYKAVFHALLDRGVAIAPGAYEVLFPGLDHTDVIIDETLEIAADAVASIERT